MNKGDLAHGKPKYKCQCSLNEDTMNKDTAQQKRKLRHQGIEQVDVVMENKWPHRDRETLAGQQ